MYSPGFVEHLCYLCLVFVMPSRLSIAALWSPAGKGLTSWLFYVMFNCDFVSYGILGRVWYLIVLIPDICRLFYFVMVFCILVLQSSFAADQFISLLFMKYFFVFSCSNPNGLTYIFIAWIFCMH